MAKLTQKPELLAPAGNMEKGRMALLYGADAIYLGGKMFGLRAFANNFELDEIAEIAAYAHSLGKKVYVTVNIFAHNEDIAKLPDYLRGLEQAKVDALLISDIGVWATARQVVPKLALHVSTQANTTNFAAAQAWEQLGAERVVLARELSLGEIKEISAKTSVELEAFVHGAMCISYSGRCLLSSYLTGRDGNRGACTQACRWEYDMYKLAEGKRPGEYFDLEEDERGTYVMNSKDLCLIEYLPQLMDAGVCSLKIEGRMKSVHYVATVVSVYRWAIDACWQDREHYSVPPEWITELNKVSHRQYTTGFAVSKPDHNAQVYTSSKYEQTHDFVGIVTGYDAANKRVYFEQRNNVKAGEPLELLQPDGRLLPFTLKDMQDADGAAIDCAPHAQQKFSAYSATELLPCSLLRRKVVKE
ncbi:U32 family peptidase [uncultured Phascolarctobacterium sp.]|uniref:peptidase U32 family protein n=1 Tax=uncultured Phascolarctobacterium sp. TaxID=512296 RepID=UPI0025EC8616|nr:U32 family peptidase [uncultured Phascolarctobacterium sp.]